MMMPWHLGAHTALYDTMHWQGEIRLELEGGIVVVVGAEAAAADTRAVLKEYEVASQVGGRETWVIRETWGARVMVLHYNALLE